MNTRTLLVAVLVTLAGASTAHAQSIITSDTANVVAADTQTPSHVAVQSSIDQSAAMRRDARFAPVASAKAASSKGLGQARALMFVGAGAFVAGALIGGDSGTIIMVGGAVVGLYGLYEYLK